MMRILAVGFLIAAACTALIASWAEGGVVGPGCAAFTPTPAAATPPPTQDSGFRFCNDTSETATGLHVVLSDPSANPDPDGGAPGCPHPSYTFTDSKSAHTVIDIDFTTPCVQPGELTHLFLWPPCEPPECKQPTVVCHYWTAGGVPLIPDGPALNPPLCDDPLPLPTRTQAPPQDCADRVIPTITPGPTVTIGPPPGPTERDTSTSDRIRFCNDTGISVSALYVWFVYPYSGRHPEVLPFTCPEAEFLPNNRDLDRYEIYIDWGENCVQPGEEVEVEFYYACGSPCHPPLAFCYTWLSLGEPVLQGDSACPAPDVTPTPTPLPIRPWGDTDCDGAPTSADAMTVLQFVARLPVNQFQPCLTLPSTVRAGDLTVWWGDVNCDAAIDPADALVLLRAAAGLPYSQSNPCHAIGQPLNVALVPAFSR